MSINGSGYIPGDTFVLRSSTTNWTYLSLNNFQGTAACPFTVTNEGGQVKMLYGFGITSSTYVRVIGNGSPNTLYGFHVEDQLPDAQGVAFGIYEKSAHIEVSHISIHHKEYGFWIKNEANCDTSINNWVLDDIAVHDVKITNTDSQGFYMGSTDPNNFDRPIICDGVTRYYAPSRLGNIRIYNNFIDTTGRGGIQLSGASTGQSKIYNNVVRNNGTQLDDAQGVGIVLGGYTRAHVYNNDIKNTLTWGIAALGSTQLIIENNTIDKSGQLGSNLLNWPANIYVDTRSTIPVELTTFIVRNNTLGSRGSQMSYAIDIGKLKDTYSTTGNYICNNLMLNSGSPATPHVAAGVVWSDRCP